MPSTKGNDAHTVNRHEWKKAAKRIKLANMNILIILERSHLYQMLM